MLKRYVKKILKPWFTYNPVFILRALFYELGMIHHDWVQVKTCFGMSIYCDTKKAIGRSIYKNGVYELPTSELIWRLLKNSPNELFVDVGANIGYYSLLARKRLGNNGMVMSFEPMPNIYQQLLINMEGLCVNTYQYAVSNYDGQATLKIPKGAESNDGIATLQDCADAVDSFTVQTVSIDQFLDKKIYILKIDVEGHEYSVLSGAKSLLSDGKIKHIIFECHDIMHSSISTLLTGFGYKIFSIGWNRKKLILKPLSEPNSSYVLDAPNYLATLDVSNVDAVTQLSGWTVLRGV